jgi:hypothetical protein
MISDPGILYFLCEAGVCSCFIESDFLSIIYLTIVSRATLLPYPREIV